MTSLDPTGAQVNVTRHHRYPLPPPIPGRPDPARDGYGRYKLAHPENQRMTAWTRATTIAKTLDDTFHLEKWKQRQLMSGLSRSDDLTAKVRTAVLSEASKGVMDGLAEDAMIAAGSAEASEFGTAVHAWLESIDHGLVLPAHVPKMYQLHVRHYLSRLAAHALTPLPQYTERIVLNSKAKAAGTLDRVYADADGRLILGDVKTSKSLDFGYLSFAVQLAVYEGADYMLSTDGTRWEPMPEMNTDYAVVLHCPSNNPEGTAAVTFDLAYGRKALATALTVRALRSDARASVPNRHAVTIPESTLARQHRAVFEMRLSHDTDDLARVWEQNQDIWTDDLTALGMSIAQELHAESDTL